MTPSRSGPAGTSATSRSDRSGIDQLQATDELHADAATFLEPARRGAALTSQLLVFARRGTIVVNTAGRPSSTLPVSDTGCGMTDEVRARIFEPFFTTRGSALEVRLPLPTARSAEDCADAPRERA